MDNKFKIRSKKYLRGAEGQPCTRCNTNDGTIVAAHYQGLRSHLYGKGTGTKVHDLLVADLCSECHHYFDSPQPPPSALSRDLCKALYSEEFLHCVALTILRRVYDGILYTDDIKRGN